MSSSNFKRDWRYAIVIVLVSFFEKVGDPFYLFQLDLEIYWNYGKSYATVCLFAGLVLW